MAYSQIPYTLLASTSSPDHSPSLPSTNSSTLSSSVKYLTPPLSSETPSLSETPSSYTRWEVFLSFCGKDTRNSFTDYVYDGLKKLSVLTYRDDTELVKGDNITEALKKAIEESKIYVVVFSENYASSSWCLDELVEIYKYHQTKKRLIISVYYKIEPAVVRYQLGSFKKAFKKHKSRADPWVFQKFGEKHRDRSAAKMRKIDTWRRTLTGVADLSGATIPEERSEIDIINQVVERILLEIKPMNMYVAEYPVGLESRVENITALMSSHTDRVTSIGIHGMGGVGKTTLAKAVYNQNYHRFEGSCFLADVRENSITERGLVCLQQQLINDVLKCKNIIIDNIDQGIELIRAKLRSIKVLIVVDDLDNPRPMKFLKGTFALGSIIFITTRNEDVLDSIKVEARYKVSELGDDESRQLFTQHAFQDNNMSETFVDLSKEIIEHAGGLPLALEVFGSMLLNQSEAGWRQFRDKLKRDAIDVVEKQLMISFDALKLVDPRLHDVFLDIACFFIGWKKEEVMKIMESCYTFFNHYVDILGKRCLLTINEKDELEMHDMLHQMGRNIARNIGFTDEPEKHTRFWASEDIIDVMYEQKGTGGAKKDAISSNFDLDVVSFNTETFKRMSKLRLLYLKNVNIIGSFEHAFDELRWLCWDSCPLECLPFEFHPQKLVTLELPGSKMRMWEPNKVFENLKTLTMKHSLELITTPNFTKLPFLEYLNLEYCENLEEVHISIGSLERLVFLNLRGCVKLTSIPKSICELRALASLNIGGCNSLKELPSELGSIESLTELIAWGLTVPKLPDSMRRLSNLYDLNLSDNEYPETPSFSASDLTPTGWDVFLSMRGMDTRFTFTSHLYSALNHHGVRVFMDDRELHSGEVLSAASSQAIQECKTYIVILSENYASAQWCLDELVQILNCCKTIGKLVIPVFYNIDPSIVRYQSGSFEQAFKNHETRFAGQMEKVNKWRHALTEVAGFSGYHISRHSRRYEDDHVMTEVVDKIIFELKPKALSVAKYPVRLDTRAKDITTLLSTSTEGTIKFGICGMSGVGKTALAKSLFNQLLLRGDFEGSCFLANIGVVSLTIKGVESLQQKLINNLLKMKKKVKVDNLSQGTKLIQDEFRTTKVLVALDDLTDREQFKSLVGPFASGSVIIITTGDSLILDKIGVEPKYQYVVNVLDHAESLELFTRHAFGNAKPNKILMVLSKDILRQAGGHPLVLEVFGSHLSLKSEVGWKSYVAKLQRNPGSTIQEKLRISLDALESDEPMLKKMFLDIACFFVGSKKEEVVKIMETYYNHVDHNIGILKKRCLLTINNRDELEMHHLLQELGREIACNNSPDEPGKHSRLWVPEDISSMLKKHEGTEVVEGIIPRNQAALEGESYSAQTFMSMNKLRFLYLKKVNLIGSFERIFEDLRWLCWDCCPLKCLPYEFYPSKLVILELPRSKMRIMWNPNMVPHVFESLKTLNMSFSQDLATTPDFSQFPCLEFLNLECCKSLEAVHMSIGSLVRLVSLNLQGCVKLRSLPDTICQLRAVEVLSIGDCRDLKALPIQLGNLRSLKELNADGLGLSKLPDSIGGLTKLVKLSLKYNEDLKTLPYTIYNLRSLENLDLGYCRHLEYITDLPLNLKWIRADGCTSLQILPNLSNLKHLEELHLTDCISLTEILGLEESSIRALHLRGCNSYLTAYITKSLFQPKIYSRDVNLKLDVVKEEILHDVTEKIDSMSVTCSSSGSSRKYTGSAYVGEIPELFLGLDLPLGRMDLIGGGVIGVAFADLVKAFIKVIKTTARFKSTFKRLNATMDAIVLIFKDIKKLEEILQRPQTELDFFVEELKRGTDLILLCSKIKTWNLYKKYVYSKKLHSFDEVLTRFFQINRQAHQVWAIRQVSKGVSDVNLKLDVVKEEILHDVWEKIASTSVTGSSAYVGEIPELVLGLDLPLEELKIMLLKDNDVLPTVVVLSAPPGCGKTILANMVCLDSTIKEKFKENIFFVTVSKAVNIQITVKTIFKQKGCLDELLEVRSDEDAINQLRQLLRRIGGGPVKNPILLVLDDVWSPGLEAFVQKFRFKEIPEYKILVTSRFGSPLHWVYKLKLLNDQDAKDLFCHSVFPPGSEHPKISEETVNKVVNACNGFPLALNVIGLSLRGKTEETWKTTLNKWSKGGSSIFDYNSLLLNNLKTSLDALDEKGMETLKEGFLDLGSFPEDQRISSTVLLDMWVELYDFDEQGMETYSNILELSIRNLLNVEPTRKDDSGDLDDRYCNGHFVTQHDMLRELAIHQSSQEAIELRKRLITEIIGKGHQKDWVGMSKQPLTARLVSISTDDTFTSSWPDIKLPEAVVLILNIRSRNYALPQFMEHMNQIKVLIVTNYGFCPAELENFLVVGHLSSLKRIRLEHVSISSTLSHSFGFQLINLQKLSLTMCEIGNALDNCANMFPHLRDFEMEYCQDLVELPLGICDIVHLEKISITRCNELRILPEEIGKLINLQSLRFNSCTALEELPETIGCLQELSLLDISDCLSLSEMPIQIGELKGLRTLHMRGCWGMSELPTSVEDLENVMVFCDERTAVLWEDYPNVGKILVKEDINLNWLNH